MNTGLFQVRLGRFLEPSTAALHVLGRRHGWDYTETLKNVIKEMETVSLEVTNDVSVIVENSDTLFWSNHSKMLTVMRQRNIPQATEIINSLIINMLCKLLLETEKVDCNEIKLTGNEDYSQKVQTTFPTIREVDGYHMEALSGPLVQDMFENPVSYHDQNPAKPNNECVTSTDTLDSLLAETQIKTEPADADASAHCSDLNDNIWKSKTVDSASPPRLTETKAKIHTGINTPESAESTATVSETKVALNLPFKCDLCERQYKERRQLTLHKYYKHKYSKSRHNRRCDMCDIQFDTKILKNKHMKDVHREESQYRSNIQCDICGKTCSNLGALTIHKRWHENILDSRGHPCDICNKIYNGSEAFKEHWDKYHPDQEYVPKVHCCEHCSVSFPSHIELIVHLKTHDETTSTTLPCEFCGKEFTNMRFWMKHQSSHQGERCFKCEFCDKPFKAKVHMQKHIRSIHFGILYYKCDLCHVRFNHLHQKHSHLNEVHGVENPKDVLIPNKQGSRQSVICDVCGKVCSNKGSFTTHMKSHINPRRKEFKCAICDKVYKHHIGLSRHIPTHTGERRFQCEICGKLFMTSTVRNSHMSIHNESKPFKCDHCESAFKNKTGLARHVKIHEGNLQHFCDVCDKGFIRADALRSHVKVHNR